MKIEITKGLKYLQILSDTLKFRRKRGKNVYFSLRGHCNLTTQT